MSYSMPYARIKMNVGPTCGNAYSNGLDDFEYVNTGSQHQ